MSTGGGQVGGGRGEGGATALRTQRPEWAVSATPGARTAPRRGRDIRQGHVPFVILRPSSSPLLDTPHDAAVPCIRLARVGR